MSSQLTRRDFLATTSAVIPATMWGRTTLGRTTLHGYPPPAGTFLRQDIGTLLESSPVIVGYRAAITAMQALPYTNPCSWQYQAAIHGTTLPYNLLAWNTCRHGDNFFWSWHRMYLYWWEKIIRNMSGDPSWALPYWNWSNLSERQLPYMFRDPVSELYHANRGSGWNTGTAALSTSDVDTFAGFAYPDFSSAQAQLQSVPHNQVHGMIGGDMGSVPTAALDPIFYLHHANMDRLWDAWLAQGGRSDPVSDSSWTNQGPFTFFDENCNQVKMTACEILRAAQQLNYTYEYECPQVNDSCDLFCVYCITLGYYSISILDIQPFNLGSGTVVVPIGVLSDQYWQAVQNSDFLTLQINKVQALQQPGASWEVYVGLPLGVEPYPESQYYVGSVVLFGVGVHGEHGGFANFNLVINRAVLGTQKGAPLSLTFVPHGPLIDGKPSHPKVRATVNVGSVSIAIGTEIPSHTP
jgi:tyrosinase